MAAIVLFSNMYAIDWGIYRVNGVTQSSYTVLWLTIKISFPKHSETSIKLNHSEQSHHRILRILMHDRKLAFTDGSFWLLWCIHVHVHVCLKFHGFQLQRNSSSNTLFSISEIISYKSNLPWVTHAYTYSRKKSIQKV